MDIEAVNQELQILRNEEIDAYIATLDVNMIIMLEGSYYDEA